MKNLAILAAAALASSQAFGQTVSTPITFSAGVASAYFGRSLAAGDFNGDGLRDLLIGAPANLGEDITGIRAYTTAGKAYIFYGPDFTTSIELGNPNPAAFDSYGWAVAAGAAGGVTDAAYVSAPLHQGGPGTTNFGAVHYYLDPSTAPDSVLTLTNPTPATAPPTSLGTSIAFAPSSTPSASTLVIGATGFSSGLVDTNGLVWRTSASAPTPPAGNLGPCVEPGFGSAVAVLPIVPFAGGSVIIGNPYALRNYASGICENVSEQMGRLHHGSIPGLNSHWYEKSPDNSLGTALATGVTEAGGLRTAAGAPFSNQVYIFDRNPAFNNPFGGPGIHPVTGLPNPAFGEPLQVLDVTAAGHAGRSVALADMDLDGSLDLIVGAPLGYPLGGRVVVFFGPAPYSDASRVNLDLPGFAPESGFCPDDLLGWSLVAADFNGDGRLDVAAGRPCDGLAEEGSVTVFFGCSGAGDCESCTGGFCQLPPTP